MRKRSYYVILALFLLPGFLIFASGLWAWNHAVQAQSWPTVKGSLTECRVSGGMQGGSPYYTVLVAYTFDVAGKRFKGSRLEFGHKPKAESLEVANRVSTDLRSSDGVVVRYDPEDPSLCTIRTGWNKTIAGMLGFSTVWILMFLLFTFLVWRSAEVSDGTVDGNLEEPGYRR